MYVCRWIETEKRSSAWGEITVMRLCGYQSMCLPAKAIGKYLAQYMT